MQIDRFTRACLLAIIILLTIFVVRPVFEIKESYAAGGVEYKVISDLPDAARFFRETEKVLNQYAKQGWELVEYSNGGWAILKR